MAGRQRLLAALVAVLTVCLAAGAGAGPLGAKAPGSAKRMKIRFTPKRGPAGTTFRGVARGFARGEPVAAHEIGGGRRGSRLPGGHAARDGRVSVVRRTFSTSRAGVRKLCLRGERTRRIACGRYRVTPRAGADEDEDDLVLEEEDAPSEDLEDEDSLLDFLGGGEDLDPDENPDLP